MALQFSTPVVPAMKQRHIAPQEAWTRKMLSPLCFLLIFANVSMPAISADIARHHKVLEHATVTVTITPSGHEGRGNLAPEAPPSSRHQLAVVLRDVRTAAVIRDAHVQADVAERGYGGTRYALTADMVEGVPGYSSYVSMPGRVPYRILIHVTLPRVDRVLEAQFEYRHHH